MENKQHVHNLIILDESGSMMSIKDTIIQGFNEVVQTVQGVAQQFPEQAHFISLVTFNGMGIKTLLLAEQVEKLTAINAELYQPNATTPLYDAIGQGVQSLRTHTDGKEHTNVLVTILTDGDENASTEYTHAAIRALIEELKHKNWTFTYIGANHDVEKVAISLSITNTMSFEANEADVTRMFVQEKSSRALYSQRIRDGHATSDNFYDGGDAQG